MTIEDDIIRCRQCGSTDASLYTEDCYQDITCRNCGARTGKYGDENECIDLWNGKDILFYIVMFKSTYSGIPMEMWDSEEKAKEQAKKYNDQIRKGISPTGYDINLSFGIRQYCTVETIKPNTVYKQGV